MSSSDHLAELESLRAQVGELSRTVAEREHALQDQQQSLEHVMQDLRAQSDLLKAIMEGTAADTGDDFFASLATHLTASLHMQYAVIGEIADGTPVTVRTLAVASGEALLDNFEYDLTQAPCGTALTESFWCYEQGVQALFPHFPPLATLGVDSHSGVSIRNKQGDAVGLIVVMDTKPITHQERLQALLHVFAPRVAAELQRKHTETALQEQTQRLAQAQALAHLGSWDWDIDSGDVHGSDEQFRIFGHEPGPFAVKFDMFLASLHPGDHDRVLAAINDALMGTHPYDLEYRVVRPNGEVRSIHARGDIHRDETGHPISMAGTILDITERKQVERALHASEERWHLVVQGSNDGIWDWNIPTGEVFFFLRWKAMRGFEDHEISNHLDEWRSRIHPDDLDRVLQNIDAYLAKQAPEFCEEYRVQRKDGSYMWILDRGAALWADDGTPLRMVGSECDITERKQAQSHLAQQELLLRSILDAEPECVKRVAADGTLLQMNEAGLCFIETDSFEQVAGRPVYDLIAPEFREPFRNMHEAVIQGASQQLEFQIVGLKGMRRWMETHAVPLWNPIDNRVEHLAITHDITERKRTQDALRESEQRFMLAVEGSSDILWDAHPLPGEPWYAPQTLIWWSPRVRELLGLEEAESFETLEQWAARLHPEDKDRVFGQLAAHVEHRVSYDAEYRLRTNRDGYRWIRGRGQAMWDEQGEICRMSGSCQDITDRKANEQLLAAEKRVLEMIATDAPLQEVLALMCQVIEALSTRARCSILLLDRDGLHLRHGAAPSLPEAYVDAIDGVAIGPTVGSCGTAAFTRRQVIVSNIADDPLWTDYRDLALRHGLLACWSTPVISSDGSVLGTFAVYYHEPQQPTHADLQLIERVAQISCIAIERKRAEAALRQNRALLQSFVEHTPAAVAMLDRDLTYIVVSKRWYQDYRLSARDIIGLHHYDVFPEIRKMEQWQAIYRRCLAGEIMRNDEDRLCREDGKEDWLRWEIRPWADEFGSVGGIIIFTEVITERKQAERKLRLTQFTIDHAVDAVYWVNRQAQIFVVNEAASLMLGYSKDELCAMTVHDLNPDFQSDMWPSFWAETQQRGAMAFETVHRSKGGKLIPVEVSINHLSYEGQEMHCAFVRNITKRKRTEEALCASEERFELAVRGSNTGIWDWDLRTNKSYFSPLWKSMLGYEDHELLGELSEWEERLHPDDLERALATVQAYLKGDIPQYELEHRLRHKDGGYRWILARGVSICDGEGRPYRMAGSHIDITEQKQTQEALAQSERQLRTVLDALPVGIWFTDPSGKPLLANPAARQIWSNVKQVGVTTAANAAGWWETIGPSDELHRWALSDVLTKGVPSLYETLDLECLDGTIKTIRNTAVPVQDEAGVVLGAIVLNEDITALRQAQEAVKLTQFSVDHAVEGFFWVGPDARILHVNEAACRMLEYTSDELTTMTVHDIDPSFPLEAWPAHWEELKQKGAMTFESKHWSRTGLVLDTEVTVNYLQYEGREYNCAIMRDIGERKRADEALRASEERYRALYDDTPTMYFKLTIDGTVLSVNRFGADQLGYRVEELIGHSVLGLFHEDDKDAVTTSFSECLATPEITRNWEFRKIRKDGRIMWVRETARVGQSSIGETVLLVSCADITSQKLAEARQARQHDQLHAIFRMTLMLSRATSLDDIYREGLDCMQRALKVDRASILLFDGAGVMRFKASRGLSERYRAAVEGHSPWTSQTVNPQPILIDDISSDPSVAQYRDIFLAEGISAIGFIPLVLPEGLLGKFMLYYDQPYYVTDEEVGVAQTIASHMAYMIQRTRTEQALRVSEERYRSLVDNAPIGIYVNEAGRFTYVNREMQRILHVTAADQLTGTPVLDWIAPEFHQVVKERIHLMMEKGQPVPPLDEQFVRLDGSRVDVSVVAIPTSLDGTTVMQVLVLDITQRKQAEEALRQNHSLLSAIMDTATDFIYVKDLAGCYLLTNPALAQFMGKSVEEVLGQDDHALLPPELAASCMTADQQVLATGTALTREEYGAVGGKTIAYLTTKFPYQDREGRIIGVIGVSRDISERKRAEEEQRKSHLFIRQIIDTDPNFIFAKDREGRFTLVNQAVADAYGTTVDNLIGKADADFNAEEKEMAFFREKNLEVMDSLQDLFLPEERIVDSAGRMRWLQTVKRPILDEQGRAIMVLGAATDITERKRMEEVLRQRERDLRAAIEERERISQDLHDGILQSLFAVGLSLETTKSMMSLKERKTSGPALKQAIDQLNRLMHEVRNFIAGLGSDLLQGTDLPTALHHMLESLTKNHATHVRLKIEDRAAQALSAEQSLHLLLVIQEAVSNCIRHGHAQEATVSLKLLKQGVRLSVRDNGCGFDSAASKGMGHGLANMAARAQRIGGRLTVLSKTNEGTRVVLDLPKEAALAHR